MLTKYATYTKYAYEGSLDRHKPTHLTFLQAHSTTPFYSFDLFFLETYFNLFAWILNCGFAYPLSCLLWRAETCLNVNAQLYVQLAHFKQNLTFQIETYHSRYKSNGFCLSTPNESLLKA